MFYYRVIYGDTDQMGVMYHANYLRLFEIGRNELFRESGKSYRELEDKKIFLPVKEAYCKYILPAKYDDLIAIRCTIGRLTRASVRFDYELTRNGVKLASGYTLHPYVSDEGRLLRFTETEMKGLFGDIDAMD